ncbi:dicer-like protein 1 [Pyricularia oryzae 70-15]|uniref:Dicer-like protein 1 n=3 Tax=Pyricularia oryzae TaxID=318829 RepID=DCL1_PYRO7|nr:dicer-like protein 1 [Pyricularia oryzae 70-15]A4RKC3.2 RecName: Full=Dicer-like protein 1; Includes: RecName: Full=Endoribonuclease DCL1; Includes: RecName: Full=ATP-dependent helicase DCL1 [Pyricularia oryzae 70-15]EHA54708.1 dicer-like protein 1 [Pyricularia oryzae 70-15]
MEVHDGLKSPDKAAKSRYDDDRIDQDSEDEAVRLVANPDPSKPRKISERKRADQAAFESWVNDNKIRLSLPSATKSRRSGIRELFSSDETLETRPTRTRPRERVIEGPREYQIELFERAKQKNTIAVLDTGTGKTLIAILLIRHIIELELGARWQGREKRITFFLVDKVALVRQQTDHIRANLDFPVTGLHGDTVRNLWYSKEYFEKLLQEQEVVVCTAEILYRCLHRSYLNISQVSLVVFDEAHHAKKNHVYARIIKDFYLMEEDCQKRPRIFGMTASPIDTKDTCISYERATHELESLLHSEIATISDRDLLKVIGSRPQEVRKSYARVLRQENTELCNQLRELVGNHPLFKQTFDSAEFAVTELGAWCADKLWELCFREEAVSTLDGRVEGSRARDPDEVGESSHEVSNAREALSLVQQWSFSPPEDGSLSTKTHKLIEILAECFSQASAGNAIQCIVFVKRRDTAVLLNALCEQAEIRTKIPDLKGAFLIGAGRGGNAAFTTTRQQEQTVSRFRDGEINCLFATSIAEEGLDIPGCNVVIRFDLHGTTIQYIQSRGRARMRNSWFIHMTEFGNPEHNRRWFQDRVNEQKMRDFCLSLPKDRIMEKAEVDDVLRGDQSQKIFVVPGSKASLTFKQSLVVLAEFVATLPARPDEILSVDYTVVPVFGGFQGEVYLPASSPLRSAMGGVYRSKQLAKCAAAYAMCIQLYNSNYLDDHLKSTLAKVLPAMRNARLAVSSKKRKSYNMRTKPVLWSEVGPLTELYAMVLSLAQPGAAYYHSRPILLLTRKPLPEIAQFPLFFGKGSSRRSNVRCIPLAHPWSPTTTQVEGICAFTLCIFRDIFSKDFQASGTDMPYFLAPSTGIEHGTDLSSLVNPERIIDWATVHRTTTTDRVPYNFNEPDEFFQDKYVSDPFDGSRKFFMRKVRRDLKPQDKVPEGVPAPSKWRAVEHTILNYSVSLWKKSRAGHNSRQDQPVVEAELAPLRRNLLDETDGENSTGPQTCYLVLETLLISQIPVDTVVMAYTFPAIIYRLENSLISLEACQNLGLDIPIDIALIAMTKDSDNSDDHDEAPINFQSGMGQNYERLEFLGDCFLKMATSIALYTLVEGDEFEYHVERMLDICNKNLLNWALESNLQEHIRSKSFNRRTWYPPGLKLLKGKKTEVDDEHALGDKSIADVCEALIGAAYLTAQAQSSPNFDLAVKAVTVMTHSKTHTMQAWSDYYASYQCPEWLSTPPSQTQLELCSQIKNKMGYRFKNPRLLRCAFMHPSYPRQYENIPSYQRLEFLGDSLLDMVCVDYLFKKHPDKDPQWLTEHKMAMVSNQFFGCVAVGLGFHRHLIHMQPALGGSITEWAELVTKKREEARQLAVRRGQREEDYARDFWIEVHHPPKCLPDILEAYVGALFVDTGYDYSAVVGFFDRHIKPYFADMSIYDMYSSKHPVTHITSIITTQFGCSSFRLMVHEIPDDVQGEGLVTGAVKVVAACMIHGEVRCHAVAASGRYAKLAVAKQAVAIYEDMSPTEFRLRHGCNCKPEDGDGDHGVLVDHRADCEPEEPLRKQDPPAKSVVDVDGKTIAEMRLRHSKQMNDQEECLSW